VPVGPRQWERVPGSVQRSGAAPLGFARSERKRLGLGAHSAEAAWAAKVGRAEATPLALPLFTCQRSRGAHGAPPPLRVAHPFLRANAAPSARTGGACCPPDGRYKNRENPARDHVGPAWGAPLPMSRRGDLDPRSPAAGSPMSAAAHATKTRPGGLVCPASLLRRSPPRGAKGGSGATTLGLADT